MTPPCPEETVSIRHYYVHDSTLPRGDCFYKALCFLQSFLESLGKEMNIKWLQFLEAGCVHELRLKNMKILAVLRFVVKEE